MSNTNADHDVLARLAGQAPAANTPDPTTPGVFKPARPVDSDKGLHGAQLAAKRAAELDQARADAIAYNAEQARKALINDPDDPPTAPVEVPSGSIHADGNWRPS